MNFTYNFSYPETSNFVKMFNKAVYGYKSEIKELENSQEVEHRPEIASRIVTLHKEIAGLKAIWKPFLEAVREFNNTEGERLGIERKEEAERKKVEREKEKAEKAAKK